MYYFYGKINWGHIVCPLYGGGPYLRESIMGGSPVITITETVTSMLPTETIESCMGIAWG